MPITLLVRTGESRGKDRSGDEPPDAPRLTFDAITRVVIGRGSSCDVRLPDPSVSHRHATVQAKGKDYVLADEGSTNGTYIGGARVAPRTSRVLRSGDMIRIGRVWLEARIETAPVTRDVATKTRDLALALVSDAMRRIGEDVTTQLRVVEGVELDVGVTLPLTDEGRTYVIGRAAECDLPLADPAASREHVQVVRRGNVVMVRDLGAKNAATLGDAPLEADKDVTWRSALVLRVSRTVIALEEPVMLALAELETAADEPLAPEDAPLTPPPPRRGASVPAIADASRTEDGARESQRVESASSAPIAHVRASVPAEPRSRKGAGWSVTDVLVMLAALSVLALSVAGLVWLLRG
jgi:pSer/pThr/pTyr-binding forkhead associated (FHA) protein